MKKYLLFGSLSILLLSSLTACHTVAGAGQDVSDTGHTITNAATSAGQSL